MPAKVLVIAFDAAEATLVEPWAADGRLPAFQRLGETGTLLRLDNHVDTLPASIWVDIATGRAGGVVGWYWNRFQLHAGEARPRQTRLEDVDLTAVWHHLSRAGLQAAVLDVPHAAPSPDLNGVQLREYGSHDTAFGLGGDPPGFLEQVLERYGPYPGPRGDECEHHETEDDFRRLLGGLKAGVDVKQRLFRDMLEEREWDLFFCTFSESHCVSHQFWGFFDETSPWYDRPAPAELRRAIPDVYERLDGALDHLLTAAGEETTVFVVLSHGMGPSIGGPQLLREVLVRLGYGSARGAANKMRSRLPTPVRKLAKRIIRGRARERLQHAGGSLRFPLESADARAASVSNGRVGAIRLNVKGRDPFGSIEPGAEYDAACEELAAEIAALVNAETGSPAIVSVARTDEVYGERRHPNVPDLVVRFNQDEGPIRAVRSPRVGTVSVPIEEHAFERSGDHTPRSRLWLKGPGIPAGLVIDGGHVLDIAPTILDVLGVPLPPDLDGRVLDVRAPSLT